MPTKPKPRTKSKPLTKALSLKKSASPEPTPHDLDFLQSKVEELTKAQSLMANRIDLTEKARAWMRLSEAGSTAYRSTTFSGTGLFPPGEPLMAMNAETEPRLFQYGVNYNLISIPRAGSNALLAFPVLRALAQSCQEIRLNIEKVKSILKGLDWTIVFEGEDVEVGSKTYHATPDIEKILDFWQNPDGINDFDAYLGMMLEEVLVTDALTLYPNHQPEGTFLLDAIDGTTIKPLIDFQGRIPRPPAPAYTQTLYGVPRSHYTLDRLMYLPRNVKVNTVYGESPIEWVVQMTVTAVKHSASRLNYYTEGNVPQAFAGLPSEWTVNQIQEFTDWFNSMVMGDEARAFKMFFLPTGGRGSLPISNFQQTNFENTGLSEWLMTVACWAYGNSPSEFGLSRGSGLGGAGYMEAGENAQYRGSISSTAQFIKRVIDKVNREHLKAPWAKFKWIGLDPTEDSVAMAQTHQVYMGLQVYNAQYVQDKLGVKEKYRPTPQKPGQPPTGSASPDGSSSEDPQNPSASLVQDGGQGDDIAERYRRTLETEPVEHPGFSPKTYAGHLIQKNTYDSLEKSVADELGKWKAKTLRYLKKNWEYQPWTSDIIPHDILYHLNRRLQTETDPQKIESQFLEARRFLQLQKNSDSSSARPSDKEITTLETDFTDTLTDYFAGLKQRLYQALGPDAH